MSANQTLVCESCGGSASRDINLRRILTAGLGECSKCGEECLQKKIIEASSEVANLCQTFKFILNRQSTHGSFVKEVKDYLENHVPLPRGDKHEFKQMFKICKEKEAADANGSDPMKGEEKEFYSLLHFILAHYVSGD